VIVSHSAPDPLRRSPILMRRVSVARKRGRLLPLVAPATRPGSCRSPRKDHSLPALTSLAVADGGDSSRTPVTRY